MNVRYLAGLPLALWFAASLARAAECYILTGAQGETLSVSDVPPFDIGYPPFSAEYEAARARGERLLIRPMDACPGLDVAAPPPPLPVPEAAAAASAGGDYVTPGTVPVAGEVPAALLRPMSYGAPGGYVVAPIKAPPQDISRMAWEIVAREKAGGSHYRTVTNAPSGGRPEASRWASQSRWPEPSRDPRWNPSAPPVDSYWGTFGRNQERGYSSSGGSAPSSSSSSSPYQTYSPPTPSPGYPTPSPGTPIPGPGYGYPGQ